MADVAVLILVEQLKDDPEDLEVFLLVLLRLHHGELLELVLEVITVVRSRLTENMILQVGISSLLLSVTDLLSIFVFLFLDDLFLDPVSELVEALGIWESWWSTFHGLLLIIVILLLYQDLPIILL